MSLYRAGQRFRVTEDRRISLLVHWRAPMSTAITCSLPVGTVLVVTADPPPGSRGMQMAPEEYDHFERLLIPADDRDDGKYDGYSVAVGADEVDQWLERIGD